MFDYEYEESTIIIREKYGWKLFESNEIKVWFCGYLYNNNIEDLINTIHLILNDGATKGDILHWIKSVNGHFSFVVEFKGWTIAAVDKIGSIPLFFVDNKNILIGNHAPLLKEKGRINHISNMAKLEMAMSGYTIANKTLFKGLKRLEAGECIFLYKGSYCMEYYHTYSPWKVVDKKQSQFQDEFVNTCLEVFTNIKNDVKNRQIVVPLSAGNDSRLVVSCLKEVGVKNVVCLSYGRSGNFETPISKIVADKLGYRWIYIKDRFKDKRQFFKSKAYQDYIKAFESFSCVPNVQEVYEIFLLNKEKLVDKDAIIINGSCGDFISGGHIRSTLGLAGANNLDGIDWKNFLSKHFSLWGDLRNKNNDALIVSELERVLSLRVNSSIDYSKYQYAIMEFSEYIGRQSKFVISQQRAYEFFGYEWRAPLWSDEMVNFWQSIPFKYKIDQKLYIKSLQVKNFGGVWHGIKVNEKKINPVVLRWIRWAFKILFFPFGKKKWHRFEKRVFEYWLHPSYSLTVTSYLNILLNGGKYRNSNSWLVRQMLKKYNNRY